MFAQIARWTISLSIQTVSCSPQVINSPNGRPRTLIPEKPGFPHVFAMLKHMEDPSQRSPSSALAIARNTGPGSFYGEKFKVTKV